MRRQCQKNTLLKKSSIFANLLMEKPDNSFAVVKMWKNAWRKNILRKGSAGLKNSVRQFSVPARPNQPPGLSVRGTSPPNIYILFHLKIENLELFVNYCNQLFLIFQVCENFAIYHYIKGEFTPLWQVFQFFLSLHFQCLSQYMCGHNLTMKFPPDFHN